MAFTYPLSLETFADLLFLEDVVFKPQRNDETTGLGSLDPLHAQLASPLWRADCSTGPINNDDAEALAGIIEMLEHPGRDFYIYNPRKLGPRSDPDGQILGSNVITIGGIGANNNQLTLQGFPNGYILSPGDMVSFSYGPVNQKRRAMHRINELGIASGGQMLLLECFPHIRAGAEVGDVVTLIRPAMRAKLISGSYSPRSAGAEHQRFSFSAIQKLV